MDNDFRRVLATPQQRKFLAEKFKCAKSMIHYALKYDKHGLLARKIRSYAINILKCPVV